MSVVAFLFSYALHFVSEYKSFPRSQGTRLQKIKLRPPKLSGGIFLLHI